MYFSKLDVIVKSKKQNLDLLKYSFLKILAFINVKLLDLKCVQKKWHSKNFHMAIWLSIHLGPHGMLD
jgi:hypothetical protein